MKGNLFLTLIFLAVIQGCKTQSASTSTGNGSPAGGLDNSAGKTTQAAENVITEKYWKLTHLGGRDISFLPGQPKEAFFILKEKDNKVQGNGGCNTFFGSYTVSEGSRIRFSDMASTMMACPGQAAEHDFLRVFEEADNYSLNGDTLTLNKARMAPLARFVAVWFK